MHLLNARGCRNSAVLPSIRIGARQIRFEEEHLLRWIENGGGLDTINPEDQESDNVQTTVAYPAPLGGPSRVRSNQFLQSRVRSLTTSHQ